MTFKTESGGVGYRYKYRVVGRVLVLVGHCNQGQCEVANTCGNILFAPTWPFEIFCRNIAFQLNWTATYSVHASVVDLMKTPPPRLHQLATSVTYGPIGPAWQVLEGVQTALRHATG